jgi:hypothetical protein
MSCRLSNINAALHDKIRELRRQRDNLTSSRASALRNGNEAKSKDSSL